MVDNAWELFDDSALQMDVPTPSPQSTKFPHATSDDVMLSAPVSYQDKSHNRLREIVLDKYGGAIASGSKRIANIVSPKRHTSALVDPNSSETHNSSRPSPMSNYNNGAAGKESRSPDFPPQHQTSSSMSTKATFTEHSIHCIRSLSLPIFCTDNRANSEYEMDNIGSNNPQKTAVSASQLNGPSDHPKRKWLQKLFPLCMDPK